MKPEAIECDESILYRYNHTLPPVANPFKNSDLGALVNFEGFGKICEAFANDEHIDQMIFGDAVLYAPPGAALEWIEASRTDEGIRDFTFKHVIFPVRYDAAEGAPSDLTLEAHCDYILENAITVSPGDFGAQYGLAGHPIEVAGDRFVVRFYVQEEFLDEEVKKYVKNGMIELPISYYWDSEDTNAGMGHLENGMVQMEKTLEFFHHQTQRFNGNVSNSSTVYAEGRSQPPAMGSMLLNTARVKNDETLMYQDNYLDMMERHFEFWTDGTEDPDKLSKDPGSVYGHAVRMPGGEVMYRFIDKNTGPRPEMHNKDVELAEEFKKSVREEEGREPQPEEVEEVYVGTRSITEHAEDFTAHLTVNGKMYRPDSHHLISVKLNSALFEHVNLLAFAYDRKYKLATDEQTRRDFLEKHNYYSERAVKIADAVRKYCIDLVPQAGVACDYNFMTGESKPPKSLSSSIWALAAGLVGSIEKGQQMLDKIDELFYTGNGLINTLYKESNEQWDNRLWPKMQRKGIQAAIQYGRYDLAYKWAQSFVDGVLEVHELTGAVWEKYEEQIARDENDYVITKNGKIVKKMVVGDGGEYPPVRNLRMSAGAIKDIIAILPYLKKMAQKQESLMQSKMLKVGQHIRLVLAA